MFSFSTCAAHKKSKKCRNHHVMGCTHVQKRPCYIESYLVIVDDPSCFRYQTTAKALRNYVEEDNDYGDSNHYHQNLIDCYYDQYLIDC